MFRILVDFEQSNQAIHWLRRDMATDPRARPNEVLNRFLHMYFVADSTPKEKYVWKHAGALKNRVPDRAGIFFPPALGIFFPDLFCFPSPTSTLPLPFHAACYLQHFGAGTFHFACYLQHLGAGTFHAACYLQHFGAGTFYFACYLPHLGAGTFHSFIMLFALSVCVLFVEFGSWNLPFCCVCCCYVCCCYVCCCAVCCCNVCCCFFVVFVVAMFVVVTFVVVMLVVAIVVVVIAFIVVMVVVAVVVAGYAQIKSNKYVSKWLPVNLYIYIHMYVE